MKKSKRRKGRKLINLTREAEKLDVERKARALESSYKYKHPVATLVYTIIILFVDIFLALWLGNKLPAYKSNLTNVLFYEKPPSSYIAYTFFSIIVPTVASLYIIKSCKIKHKAMKSIIFQLVCNIVAIVIFYNSYNIITSNRVYTKRLFKENMYMFSDIKTLKVEAENRRGEKECGFTIELKNGNEIGIVSNPNRDFEKSYEFIKFDKSCIGAKRYIDKELRGEYKKIIVSKFGEKNTEYILKSYKNN
ncbi:hypothetical protein BJV85_001078 [Clostridium acetobutylicum]|uniref:Predicted membrane protein n=1 Tax=Clostridium acetobutylicum (strain ATCC 824 / DSM 792 / JCM 1419 / IAM 19013 / LMG 5710 / NBRC 13948 / NRRL B-527 / VKM B-1787 / 2291 / W) TaxID=272562 RepID=Q97FC3_CLOAB|nr:MULTISPECIES: hypothetical protein [Clostridium]AAK80761.1 Predicted membrane protein [Clostridium acetobutylicum ATCC 824]ADZ21862.1 membrane protein [Clostridium acetobutylicum EA 2018]AEI32570.1 hypothetical protein SMB_G2853 [Clostridium acetobutylicum DSM 1731]AWV78826.1 hypothetical protein DK921_01610 [Clostridium acetobutylicum]MBC2393691.1 hypothetical protein [Clostridium acetobutylicum]